MKPKTDFASLAREASEEIRRGSKPLPTEPPKPSQLRWPVLVACAALAILAMAAETRFGLVDAVTEFVMPARTARHVQADLETILDQAKAAIDGALGADGGLPDALPNAALAALVRYDRVGKSSYRLTVSGGDVVVTQDSAGNRSISGANK